MGTQACRGGAAYVSTARQGMLPGWQRAHRSHSSLGGSACCRMALLRPRECGDWRSGLRHRGLGRSNAPSLALDFRAHAMPWPHHAVACCCCNLFSVGPVWSCTCGTTKRIEVARTHSSAGFFNPNKQSWIFRSRVMTTGRKYKSSDFLSEMEGVDAVTRCH